MDPNTKIAGTRTVKDWLSFRKMLAGSRDPVLWRRAGTEYFHERILARYMKPLGVLQSSEASNGEGFSIVTIQCALLEFLAAAVAGKNFRYSKALTAFEYSNSHQLFVRFLTQEQPFAKSFSKEAAEDFYTAIRCGLLHEAQTKNGWRIRTHKPDVASTIDFKEKILYRHGFQRDLDTFIKRYRDRLTAERPLQEGFIRKFDHICGLEPGAPSK
ncbi:MAG: hypothetical protein WDM91_00540 [Rhizomicrobium sp.]